VQGEPFLGLLDAVVEEFVVQLTRPQRSQQVAPEIFRKLAGMDGHIDQGAHGPFLPENNRQDKAPGSHLSFEPPLSETPSANPKLQRSSGIETPKTKLQTPKKSQVQSSKPRPALRAWNLELLWCLVFSVWSLELGASLELGVWNLEPFARAPSFSNIEMRPKGLLRLLSPLT
jgi:hypothetical protein